MLARINRVTLSSSLKIPHKEPYDPWTFDEAKNLYSDNKKSYDSIVAQTWLLKLTHGGSRFPKPITIKHFIKEIVDIVLLLNRVKRNDHVFHWESWMYFFIKKIVEGENFIDWFDLIAEGLHKGLLVVSNFGSFFTSSFLIYILAVSREWEGLPHEPWVDDMTIYQYYTNL